MNSNNKSVIEIKDLIRTFTIGDIAVHALRGISLNVNEREFVAIMGASGSGKSTLMNLIGCLDVPTSGEYYLDGLTVNNLTPNEFATIRNQKIGFVFQNFNLLARTTAVENVELPLLYDRGNRVKNPRQAALDALGRVGLSDRIDHEPNQLSGGQQQRLAIARALVNRPAIILADEPTGNLDSRTSIEVMALFQELNNQGITIILVTHEQEIAEYSKRVIMMRDGSIIDDHLIKNRQNARDDLESLPKDDLPITQVETQ